MMKLKLEVDSDLVSDMVFSSVGDFSDYVAYLMIEQITRNVTPLAVMQPRAPLYDHTGTKRIGSWEITDGSQTDGTEGTRG